MVRWLSDLRVSVVVAAHPRYIEGAVNRDHLLEFLDTQISIPQVPNEKGLARILERRVVLNTEDSPIHQDATLLDVMSSESVSALYQAYRAGNPLRKIIQLSHIALAEATSEGANTISADHIAVAFQF